MTDLRYQGTTISGWNPSVKSYNMDFTAVPNLDDFTADITGASAVLTKTMEQNADGTYRIAISVVSGDLQTASCYLINATVTAPEINLGDVDDDGSINIADITTLIDYILTGDVPHINMLNADVDMDGVLGIADVTKITDYLLKGSF